MSILHPDENPLDESALDAALNSLSKETNKALSAEGGGFGAPAMGSAAYKRENRIAKIDITEGSKENHSYMTRCTQKEMIEQLKKDFAYLKRGVIMPFVIIENYPFKKKESDSDIPNKSNVVNGMAIFFGRLPKWKNIIHQIKTDATGYIIGEAMYLPRGRYNVGDLGTHIALVEHERFKKISKKDLFDLFDPIDNELQNFKPVDKYTEFPRPADF